MAETFGGLDWRDRPKASPTSGAIVQSRRGKNGDFHVVLPFPGGGLVHWWRDNFRPDLPWLGGTLFGSGKYSGAAICETDYASHPPGNVKNLEVVAVADDGRVEVWTRECGGAFRWQLYGLLSGYEGAGAPSLSYTGACFRKGLLDIELESHGDGSEFIAFPDRSGSIRFWWCINRDKGERNWYDVRVFHDVRTFKEVPLSHFDPRPVTGVSVALIVAREEAISYQTWKKRHSEFRSVIPDSYAFATVFNDGGISVFDGEMGRTGVVVYTDWAHRMTLSPPVPLTRPLPGGGVDRTPARGRPCTFQSDYLLEEWGGVVPVVLSKSPQVGDLVVMAPARDGGILFWLKNFGDYNDPLPFGKGWNFQYVIGAELYDDVSVIQGNFLREGHDYHNLEITARRADLEGFHQYWADWKGNWGGPVHVRGEVTGTIQQGLTPQTVIPGAILVPPPPQVEPPPADPIAVLARIGVDYSVGEAELREWLADSDYTPYPALAQALASLIGAGRLARPVQIDVIRGFYEAEGVPSPRAVADVDLARLQRAIVDASNERYGTAATDFMALVAA